MNPMRLLKLICAVVLCLFLSHRAVAQMVTFGSGPNQFSIEFVPIGNPDNIGDEHGIPKMAGAVSYVYGMGKYEVSEDMIAKFNASQSLNITKDTRGADKPATNVSWNEAARFVNWLNTTSGGFAAYKFTTPGVNDNISPWTPADTLDYDAANPFPSLRAIYVLPSADEWYKAAYYDSSKEIYFDYPVGRYSPPNAVAGGTDADSAVYSSQAGPADVTNAGGLSPYGIMGLGGNVYEWEETESDLLNDNGAALRGIRGGDWGSARFFLQVRSRSGFGPTSMNFSIGFRVVCLASTVTE